MNDVSDVTDMTDVTEVNRREPFQSIIQPLFYICIRTEYKVLKDKNYHRIYAAMHGRIRKTRKRQGIAIIITIRVRRTARYAPIEYVNKTFNQHDKIFIHSVLSSPILTQDQDDTDTA